MSDFDKLSQALDAFKIKKEPVRVPPTKASRNRPVSPFSPLSPSPPKAGCQHLHTVNTDDLIICEDCGEEINRLASHDKEWRYYGGNDSKHTSDPNRVQMRKSEERTIYKDVENMGFSEKLVTAANKLYIQVTKGKICRGNSRRAIVFACIYIAYKTSGNHQGHNKLIEAFKITRKSALKGLRYVSVNSPKETTVKTTTSQNSLVDDIMDSFSATSEQKAQVSAFYDQIRNKSSKLNRSRPQSVASGLVYYWIKMEGKAISLKDFAERTKLSELTITNIAKEIADVLETPNIF